MPARERVRIRVAPSTGSAAAASGRTNRGSRSLAARWRQSTSPSADISPTLFQYVSG
jgi:hypothetical protein